MSESDQSEALLLSKISRPWGRVSRVFCVLGGLVSILGGMMLAGLQAQSGQSLLSAIANGIGVYCIGKGLFMISATINFQAALQTIRRR